MRHPILLRKLAAVMASLLVFCLAVAGAQPAHAAPAAQPFGGDPLNPFPTLFPELTELPAPAWLKEGLRVSYYVQSATIGEDGGGGAGYFQNDVVAKEADLVVVSTAFYLDSGSGQVLPSGVFGAAFRPGYGDWWVNPAILEEAEAKANDDLAVVRMPATVAGETYDAVRFEYHGDDSVAVWMFEAESGILIYSRHTVGSAGDAQHSSSESYLVDRRTLKLPWQAKRAPAWVKRGGMYDYEGVRSLAVAGTPSGQFAEAAEVRVGSVRPRWSRYEVTSYFNGQLQGAATRVAGVAQLNGALWLPAEALKANVRRPLIDRDPVTGVETYYTRAGGTVVMEERGPLHTFVSTYDGRTGMLLRSHLETQIGLGLNVTDLELVQ